MEESEQELVRYRNRDGANLKRMNVIQYQKSQALGKNAHTEYGIHIGPRCLVAISRQPPTTERMHSRTVYRASIYIFRSHLQLYTYLFSLSTRLKYNCWSGLYVFFFHFSRKKSTWSIFAVINIRMTRNNVQFNWIQLFLSFFFKIFSFFFFFVYAMNLKMSYWMRKNIVKADFIDLGSDSIEWSPFYQ